MTSQTPLVDLANEILQAAAVLQDELSKRELAQPSHGPTTGRGDYHDVHFVPAAMDARAKLIEASQAMTALALGPADSLRAVAYTERMRVNVLRAVHVLGIAEAVPSTGSISMDALAAKVGAHAVPLRRVLRFAYTMRLFREPADQPDHVAHTPMSALIPATAPVLWLQLGDATQMQASAWQLPWALRNWPAPPLARSDPARRDFWTIVDEDEPDGRGMALFTAAMRSGLQSMLGHNSRHVAVAFDWAGLGDGLVVDVGGGSGHMSLSVAREFPRLCFVVQDLAKNGASASELMRAAASPAEAARVRFQAHDFFTPQPERDAKAYLLGRVLHDWPDDDCVRILSQLLPGLRRGARLFLVERVLPNRPGEIPLHQEAQHRVVDLIMYSILGGCERSLDDWQKLLSSVDPALEVRKVTAMPGSELSAIDAGFRVPDTSCTAPPE